MTGGVGLGMSFWKCRLQVQQLTKESLLDNIQLYRVHNATELLAVVRMLPEMLQAAPQVSFRMLLGFCVLLVPAHVKGSGKQKRACQRLYIQHQFALICRLDQPLQVKLVVVDSVAFPFRHGFTDMGARTRALGDMGNRLMQLAHTRDIAVRSQRAFAELCGHLLAVGCRGPVHTCLALSAHSFGEVTDRVSVSAQVVLMNQVTTQRREDGSSAIVPALGTPH